MKIIVLSQTKYKENDVIYDAISETETVSFKAYRGQDNKSQYLWLNNPLTIAEVEFADRRYKHPTLKEAKLISSPMTDKKSLEYFYCLNVVTEIANKMFQPEERYVLFKDIEESINALKEKEDYLMVMLILLARAIKASGAELEVNSCVFCGATTDIVAFSFADGGFVCRNCASDSVVADLTPLQMKLIRYIFKSPDYSCEASDMFSKEDKITILKHLSEYIYDEVGVSISSIQTLYK